jgi:hypothetical protein
MSSKQTDLDDRRERARLIDEALDADRRGRDRLRDRADTPPPSRDDSRRDLPNTSKGLKR